MAPGWHPLGACRPQRASCRTRLSSHRGSQETSLNFYPCSEQHCLVVRPGFTASFCRWLEGITEGPASLAQLVTADPDWQPDAHPAVAIPGVVSETRLDEHSLKHREEMHDTPTSVPRWYGRLNCCALLCNLGQTPSPRWVSSSFVPWTSL